MNLHPGVTPGCYDSRSYVCDAHQQHYRTWWALLTTSPEAHFTWEEAIGGKAWCAVGCVSEDGAVISCWTTLLIGMTWRWLLSRLIPRRRRWNWMSLWAAAVSPVRNLVLILPRKGAKKQGGVACDGKWALACGWSAVPGDFRSQMRVAWPRSGFTITWRQTLSRYGLM